MFEYSFKDILRELLHCLCIRRLDKRVMKARFRKQLLYRRAMQKLNNNFDSLSLLKTMQIVRLITPLLLNPMQKLLMHFQKS